MTGDYPYHLTHDAGAYHPGPDEYSCGCVSHDPMFHQDSCGHCGAGPDESCAPDCPVDGTNYNPDEDTCFEETAR